jgi:hypothetical protein
MKPFDDIWIVVTFHGIMRDDGWQMLFPESHLSEESILGKVEYR